jgi:hypothetical protein
VDHLYVMPTPLRPSTVLSETSAITTTVDSRQETAPHLDRPHARVTARSLPYVPP